MTNTNIFSSADVALAVWLFHNSTNEDKKHTHTNVQTDFFKVNALQTTWYYQRFGSVTETRSDKSICENLESLIISIKRCFDVKAIEFSLDIWCSNQIFDVKNEIIQEFFDEKSSISVIQYSFSVDWFLLPQIIK